MRWWRRRWRGWRRRGGYWRRRGPGRRFRGARRYARRNTVRRRRKRYTRRKKRTVTFWNPTATKRCTITGWMIGITSTATSQIPCVCCLLMFTAPVRSRKVIFKGGGMNLNVFSLQFLWLEHKLFHNYWSQSNDGFDLARYFGTTIYLPPHKDNTYVFWWDTDFNNVTRQDFWKTQPSLLLAYKNKRIIRPQREGNYKTKKVTIKPPATVSNQWRFQGNWMTMGLFVWGISLIDFNLPFAQKTVNNPLGIISVNVRKVYGGTQSLTTLRYAHWADDGHNNWAMVRTDTTVDINKDLQTTGMTRINEADDLPYWIIFWGQNYNYNMDDVSDGMLNAQSYCMIYWWLPDEGALENMTYTKGTKYQLLVDANAMYRIASAGPFVQRQNATDVNIPIMYRSKWQWGGATMNRQAIQPYIHFAPNQVAVRNPATIERSIITPWDCDHHGILTDEALKRFLRPSGEVDARRPFTRETEPEEDVDFTSSAEEVTESEEDEKGQENQQELVKALKRLRTRVQREQSERHRLRRFLYGLINPKQE
nr:ORF1 [Torque teno felis virus]